MDARQPAVWGLPLAGIVGGVDGTGDAGGSFGGGGSDHVGERDGCGAATQSPGTPANTTTDDDNTNTNVNSTTNNIKNSCDDKGRSFSAPAVAPAWGWSSPAHGPTPAKRGRDHSPPTRAQVRTEAAEESSVTTERSAAGAAAGATRPRGSSSSGGGGEVGRGYNTQPAGQAYRSNSHGYDSVAGDGCGSAKAGAGEGRLRSLASKAS